MCVDDCIQLQNDFTLEEWCGKWQMQINTSKTKFLNFRNKRNSTVFNYSLFDAPIERVHTYKYLGVHFTPNISWNISWKAHINHITAKANQSLGFYKTNITHGKLGNKTCSLNRPCSPAARVCIPNMEPPPGLLDTEIRISTK